MKPSITQYKQKYGSSSVKKGDTKNLQQGTFSPSSLPRQQSTPKENDSDLLNRLEKEMEIVQSNISRGDFPKKVMELTVANTSLNKTNEVLRSTVQNETIVNEEQRAFIEFLKNLLDNQLAQQGLVRMKGTSTSQLLWNYQNLEKKHREITSQMAEMEQRVVLLEKENSDLQRRSNQNLQENEGLEKMNGKMAQDLKEALVTIEKTEARLRRLEEEKARLGANFSESEGRKAELQKRLKDFEVELQRLQIIQRQHEDELKNKEDEVNNLRRTNNSLSKELDDVRISLKEMHELRRNVGKFDEVKEENWTLKEELNLYRRENEELKEKIDKDETNRRRMIEELKERNRNERASFEDQVRNEKRTKEKLDEEVSILRRDNAKLRDDLIRVSQEYEETAKRYDSLSIENMTMKQKEEEKLKEAEFTRDDYVRKVSSLNGELAEVTMNYRRMRQELEDLEGSKKDVEVKLRKTGEKVNEVLVLLKAFVSSLELVSRRNEFHMLQSVKLKDLILKFDVYGKIKDELLLSRGSIEYIVSWVEALLEEIDLLLRQNASLKKEVQEHKENIHKVMEKTSAEVFETKGKLSEINELRREVAALREEKNDVSREKMILAERENRIERENDRMRNENKGLIMENERLKQRAASLSQELQNIVEKEKLLRQREDCESEAAKLAEDKAELFLREKRSLEELFEIVSRCVHFPSLKQLIAEAKRLQDEVDSAEKAKNSIEQRLIQRETELKLSLKKGTPSISLRKEVDALREELENCQTQLGIFSRKKQNILDEIREVNEGEKRRVEVAIDMERDVLDTRGQLEDMRRKFEDLRNENERIRTFGKVQNYERQINEIQKQMMSTKAAGLAREVPKHSRTFMSMEPSAEELDLLRKMEEDSKLIEQSLQGPKVRLREKLETAKQMLDDMRKVCNKNDSSLM